LPRSAARAVTVVLSRHSPLAVAASIATPPRLPGPLTIFFFFNDTATTEIYTLSLHDALPISSMAKKAQSPTTRASMSSWNVTPPSNSSDPWARSKRSLSLAWRSASESGIGKGLHSLEADLGDHGAQRLLVGLEGAGHGLVRVRGGQPTVLGGTVHAVVEKRTAQELVEIAPARPIESGQSRPALERHVDDGGLAEAGAGRAHALHHLADARAQLVRDLVGARVQPPVGHQLEGGGGRRCAHGIGVEGAVLGHALRAIPHGIATMGHGGHERLLPAHRGPGEPARDDLGEGGEIRSDAEVLLCAAGRIAEARDHLVEDQHHVVPLGQRAQFL